MAGNLDLLVQVGDVRLAAELAPEYVVEYVDVRRGRIST